MELGYGKLKMIYKVQQFLQEALSWRERGFAPTVRCMFSCCFLQRELGNQ